MAKLNAVIRGLANNIVHIQEILDYETALAIHEAQDDEIKKTMPVSKANLEDMDLSLRFSLLGIRSEVIDDKTTQVMDVELEAEALEQLPKEVIHELNFTLAIEPIEVVGSPEEEP